MVNEGEMTLREVSRITGLSRTRISGVINAGELPARLELTPDGKAQRLVQAADLETWMADRVVQAQSRRGSGRRPKLPPGAGSIERKHDDQDHPADPGPR